MPESPTLTAPELRQPANHGVVLDFTDARGRRVHVRLFTFREETVPGRDATAEFPCALAQTEAPALLLQGAAMIQQLTAAEVGGAQG